MGQKEPPETHADRYRKRAAELRLMAKKATSEDTRAAFETMARQYEKLADQAGQRGY
ncbi:MAG: hypothetical protein JO128_00075 [Alphaproteobacteria bacterium]|nr:hypothetical protein [Alphaproteobacteria bacterium]